MIEPTIDMIPRALFVLLMLHVVFLVIDLIRSKTTFKDMNRCYFWRVEAYINTLFVIDAFLFASAFAIWAMWYILTGNMIWNN